MEQIEFKIPRTRESLPILVRDKILHLLQQKSILPGALLPNEFKLATMLGVSRGTLREGLRLLEEDGLIVRRPGIGTYIKDEHLITQNPLEVNFSVTEIIKSIKLKPGTVGLNLRVIKTTSSVSEKLGIQIGSPCVFIEAVRTADEKPFVYAMNVFSVDIIPANKTSEELKRNLLKILKEQLFKKIDSLYQFLEKECGKKIDYGIAKIVPSVADSALSKKLEISMGSPILVIEQVNYDLHHKPILYNREYWIKDSFKFTIFRKRKRKF